MNQRRGYCRLTAYPGVGASFVLGRGSRLIRLTTFCEHLTFAENLLSPLPQALLSQADGLWGRVMNRYFLSNSHPRVAITPLLKGTEMALFGMTCRIFIRGGAFRICHAGSCLRCLKTPGSFAILTGIPTVYFPIGMPSASSGWSGPEGMAMPKDITSWESLRSERFAYK